MFVDKILSCKECGRDFDFTASEQEFYAQKGFTNEPGGVGMPGCTPIPNERQPQLVWAVRAPHVCSRMRYRGKDTTLPFKPSGDRPVYCRDCYKPQARRTSW